MRSEAEARSSPDEPLGRVVLEPLDGIAKVHRELVVEIVVPFADGAERSDEVVAWSVLVVKRLVAEPMRERVDTESRLADISWASLQGDS